MAIISKDITLGYDEKTLTNLQSVPDLGGDEDSIEVTTLADSAHVYISGLKNYGDNLAFEFIYEAEQFSTLQALTGEHTWKVTLPDNSTCSFNGTSSVKLAGVGVNEALTYTLAIKPTSEMVWAMA